MKDLHKEQIRIANSRLICKEVSENIHKFYNPEKQMHMAKDMQGRRLCRTIQDCFYCETDKAKD